MKILISKGKFSKNFKIPVRLIFQIKASENFLVSHTSFKMVKFPKLNVEDSSERWYVHLKLRIKVEASNRNF